MHSIQFTYQRPRGFLSFFGIHRMKKTEKEIHSPDSWSTLSKRQLKKLGAIFEFKKLPAQNEFWLLYHWSNVPRYVLMEISELDVFNLIQFIYVDCSMSYSKYTWHGILLGPGNFMKNMTMDQFGMSQLVFNNYMDSEDPKHLNTLAALCYRPFFMSFKNWMVKPLELYFRFLVPRYKKMAMCINYVALRNKVMAEHPNIFPVKEKEEDNLFGWKPVEYDWEHTTMMIAGERFGTVDHARKMKVIPVLKYCEMMAIENKKNKKK